MIRVLLADDHGIVRNSIQQMLSFSDEFSIVGEAQTGEEAVAMARELRPDIVIMDLNMPEMDGFSASLLLLQPPHPAKILVMSGQESPIVPICLLKAGVLGYISKGVGSTILIEALKAVYDGKQYFEDHQFLMESISNSMIAQLSARELQIILMTVRGIDTQGISKKLFLSQKTVQGNLRKLMKTLGLSSTIELVHLAVQQKLLNPDTTRLEHEKW